MSPTCSECGALCHIERDLVPAGTGPVPERMLVALQWWACPVHGQADPKEEEPR